ncbi:four helix bundle protein [Patescibacteria group bacterium]|nr:four helix bundle protein [Patescibacteria group bacterium]
MKLTNPKAQITLERIRKLIKEVAILVDNFPKTTAAFKIAGQIIDSVTSAGANFIEAQSARSKKEFISIIGVALREINETNFWLDIIQDLKLCSIGKAENISAEATELAKIFASIIMTSSKSIK